MTARTPEELVKAFPAKFTDTIIAALEEQLFVRGLTAGTVLDPFAGVGGVHQLADRYPALTTLGIEIEPELAELHPRTVHGDSRRASTLTAELCAAAGRQLGPGDKPWVADAIVTSPAYGNRLADQYLGSDGEKCRPCAGRGWVPSKGADDVPADELDPIFRQECTKCAGSGRSKSKRMGYAIALGRKCSPGSGAAVKWGAAYRELHDAVIADVAKLLRPGGWWLVNVSSSLDGDGYVPVMEWWVGTIARHARVVDLIAVETPRIKFGANADRRVPAEHVIVAQSPE